ncbi:recombinase family protein [Neptuniibacter caesariensis]|uniref:Putative site-specific recombinase n=1 Tax=Neptuniibacter caesariensis TaxID=207954 RepID=A0A7U8CAP7_NEPCE|nr:recombinase family protein [Neptuniibacter caesariensis]EAR62961.1 putative site-specific recombinase [Oceanospirillum sp. MED92] [Neptuniibacter caesariensis]
MKVYAYLRASTEEQDATRAAEVLIKFAQEKGFEIAEYFVENASGTKLDRPKLIELINTAGEGDVLLVEQVDRLTRLTAEDWSTLKRTIEDKGLLVVSLDLPTSFAALQADDQSFTGDILKAVNRMLMDILATTARKDQEDRLRRQRQGIKRAQDAGKYNGRQQTEEGAKKVKKFYQQIDLGNNVADSAKVADISRAYGYKLIKMRKMEAKL